MGDNELMVISKTYDLVKWSCEHTSRFPRNHRFVLGEPMERRLYELLETLIQAKYTRNRQELLRRVAGVRLRPPTAWGSMPEAGGSLRSTPATRPA